MFQNDDLYARAYRALMCCPGRQGGGGGALHDDRAAGRLPLPLASACPVLPVETPVARPAPSSSPTPPCRAASRARRRARGAAARHRPHRVQRDQPGPRLRLSLPGLPDDYYDGWLQVAREEAHHFGLVSARLADLGFAYGDFPAHRGLWDMAVKTAADPLARMALVPRVLEARGLDATPPIVASLRRIGDEASIAVLDIILRDEIGHVALGDRWFRHFCAERGLEPRRPIWP
jgi:hypothetical protein